MDFNAFREKINILERGLDDRAVEIMKYLLLAQLQQDLDVVELLFHDLDTRTAEFRFVAVLSDGVEQYISMPGAAYQKIAQDVQERLFTSIARLCQDRSGMGAGCPGFAAQRDRIKKVRSGLTGTDLISELSSR